MFSPVARERRDARPRGRAAGPAETTPTITSTEVARVRALTASDRFGSLVCEQGEPKEADLTRWNAASKFG